MTGKHIIHYSLFPVKGEIKLFSSLSPETQQTTEKTFSFSVVRSSAALNYYVPREEVLSKCGQTLKYVLHIETFM